MTSRTIMPPLPPSRNPLTNTALTLGYNVETGTKYGGSAIDEYIATQILIWLIAHEQLGTGYETQIVNEFTANSPAAKPIFYQLRENVVKLPHHPVLFHR